MIMSIMIKSILAIFAGLNVALIVMAKIKIHLAYERLKKRSRGLKLCPGYNPLVGHMKSLIFRPNANMHLMDLHEKCGKTFLFMAGHQACCSSVDLDLIKCLIVDESHSYRMIFDFPIKEIFVDNVFTTRNWRPIRKAIASALMPMKFKTPGVMEEVQRSIEKFINAIETKLNVAHAMGREKITLDADDYCHRYSLDLALNCFYKQDNLIDFHAKQDEMVETMDNGFMALFNNPLVSYVMIYSLLNPLIDWLVLRVTKIGQWRMRMMEFIRLQTKSYIELKKKEKEQRDGKTRTRALGENMIGHYIDQYLLGKMSWQEYLHSALFLLTASDKTSADGLTSVLYYLSLDQTRQEKLRKDINLNGVDSEYLQWVIDESLRLNPPVPLGCSRIIERDIELEAGRVLVPSGTGLLTPVYAIHRLQEYWGEDANEFKPERFADKKSFHPCQFMPFGAGPRRCPGKAFAVHEIKLILVQLINRYKFSGKAKQNLGFDSLFFVLNCYNDHTVLDITRV